MSQILTILQIFATTQLLVSIASLLFIFPIMNEQLLIPRVIPNIRYFAFAVVVNSLCILMINYSSEYNYLFIFNCCSLIIASSVITNHRRQYFVNWMNVVIELLFTITYATSLKLSSFVEILQLLFVIIRFLTSFIFILILFSRIQSKYYLHFKKLLPFLIPKTDRKIQCLILLSLVFLLSARVVNLLLPLQYKHIVDSLTGNAQFYVEYIVVYTVINLLQGGNGLLASLQNISFIPVRQFISKSVGVAAFSHLHHLSISFHVGRKTGEILRIMDRGVGSIGNILQSFIFNVLPIIIDISIAIGYFVIAFDLYFGLILFIAMFLYILFTILITEWRTKLRRAMIDADNKMSQIAVDSLLNFETVKLYNNEEFETNRYGESVDAYNKHDFKSFLSLSILNMAQNAVICFCTLTVALYAGYLVNHGTIGVGDFVMLITYLQQLYQPLNFFGTFYRIVAQNLVDLEKLIDLMELDNEVSDVSDAEVLRIEGGEIKIKDLSFSYDGAVDVLKHINMTIKAGESVALVGSSGGGKSTLIKVLFRFYDASRGSVLIDGQDVLKVKQNSLRSRIGVVPQDIALFNETILYNVRYSRPSATDEQVYEACRLAQIHDKIIGFPMGYQTIVGERGLRLSGGEKQRLAIARTFLKDPAIIFYDVLYP
eukprot:NODE_44_length_28780_cov_0.148496.p3 type:complete len:656 gc:universal NODE_44_length_28780_cov_0.148496:19542-21509(+)